MYYNFVVFILVYFAAEMPI